MAVYLSIIVLFILVILWIVKPFKYYREKGKVINEFEFVEVETFDNDNYVKSHFDSIFYSIQFEDWEREISYNQIKYSKRLSNDKYASNTIVITFEYKFTTTANGSTRTFDIDEIKLSDGPYTTYRYKDKLPVDIKKFLYQNYFDWISENNSKAKERADISLKNIKECVGKSSERGSKIDKLLGGK